MIYLFIYLLVGLFNHFLLASLCTYSLIDQFIYFFIIY